MKPSIKIFNHGPIRVHEVDLSHKTLEEAGLLADEYFALLASAKDQSLYVLFNAEGAPYDQRQIQRFKAAMAEAQRAVKRTSVYGLNALLRVTLDGYFALGRLLGHNIGERVKACKTREEALDWLSQG